MKICDLHTHILPQVDDGARNMQDALEMLSNATASDVHSIILTPHCNRPLMADNFYTKELLNVFEELKEKSAHLPLKIALGCEFHVTNNIKDILRQKKIMTLNNSRYLLTEFPVNADSSYFKDKLQEIREYGYIPLIAHPERYDAVIKQPYIVEDWLENGCHIQLTGASIVGRYGKTIQKTAQILLKNDYVCCVASDAHGTVNRNNNLLDVYSFLSLYYSKQYAKMLLWDNPDAIFNNADLL